MVRTEAEVPTGRSTRIAVGRMWQQMAAQRRELVVAALLGFLASASAVALLGSSAWLIARAAEVPPVLTLTVAAVMVRFFALGRAVFRYAERVVGHDAAFRGLTGLRVRVYQRLEVLAPVGLSRFSRGDLLSRLVADVDAALDLPLRVVLPWVQAGLVGVATVAALAWVLPTAGVWIALLGLVALVVTPWVVSAAALRAEHRIAPTRAQLSEAVVTALGASADLLANDADPRAIARITAVDREATDLMQRESLALGFGGGLSTALQGAAVAGSLAIAIPVVRAGNLVPVWLAVLSLVPLALFDVLAGLPAAALALQRLAGSARRLVEVEGAADPVHEPTVGLAIVEGPLRLQVQDLRARWSADRPDALTGISFDLDPGARLAIVGPSGSGKSTLAAVLMGFLDYQGSVRFNDRELRDLDHDALRRRVGILAQRSHVFDTTVEENVRLGRRDVGDEQVWHALEQAQLAATIRSMPDGVRTKVGSFGMALSGGEAQRLSLARLLVEARSLVILDEPTEHLDGQAAAEVERTLEQATAASSRILITHRVTSIQATEIVLVLCEGRVLASGTAARLRDVPGWFADRWVQEQQDLDMIAFMSTLPVGRGVRATGSGRT